MIHRLFGRILILAFAVWISTVSPVLAASNASIQTNLVTLENRFEVNPEQLQAFLERWNAIGQYMNQQPGFMSAELHKDILSHSRWTMVEQWNSLENYKKAVSLPQFQALIQDFPADASWFAPQLFSNF